MNIIEIALLPFAVFWTQADGEIVRDKSPMNALCTIEKLTGENTIVRKVEARGPTGEPIRISLSGSGKTKFRLWTNSEPASEKQHVSYVMKTEIDNHYAEPKVDLRLGNTEALANCKRE